jgi:hypothetical protein
LFYTGIYNCMKPKQKSIAQKVFENKSIKNLITDLGIKTYNNLVRSSKGTLLSFIVNGEVKKMVGSPSEKWVDRNKTDLGIFKDHIQDNGKKHNFPDRIGKYTITQEIKKLIDLLEYNDFYGFIEDGEWSILNRLGSNWSNWVAMIKKRDDMGHLKSDDLESKVYEYFEQRPIDEFGIKHKESTAFNPTLSMAEYDIIYAFVVLAKEFKNDELDEIRTRLKKTTEKGENNENEFIKFLSENGITDIKNFSSYGNLVDMTFQVDLMANINGTLIPIQVKSSEKSAFDSKIHQYNFGGIAVYPLPKKSDCGKWGYVDKKSSFAKHGSFDEDFLNVSCDSENN